MAMVIITAMLTNTAMLLMSRLEIRNSLGLNPKRREEHVISVLEEIFKAEGWSVDYPKSQPDVGFDLEIQRQNIAYLVEVKIASEGRADRLIPVWSQAYLQAKRVAKAEGNVLVVIAAPRISDKVIGQLMEFAAEYAADASIGILDFQGFRIFRGPHLEGLDAPRKFEAEIPRWPSYKQSNLFSDLNQWMLKILIAPDIPENLLEAPRNRYKNASELAAAANVSIMSASRFVRGLKEEGYLEESKYLNVVRRRQLFELWKSSSALNLNDVPLKMILRRDYKKELDRIFRHGRKCLGLFAAAEAFHLGFVLGIPPHVYVCDVDENSIEAMGNLRPIEIGEQPDFIFRRPRFVESVFRGIVLVEGVPVSDILQVWLDVAAHPSRGAEQARVIEKEVLHRVFINS